MYRQTTRSDFVVLKRLQAAIFWFCIAASGCAVVEYDSDVSIDTSTRKGDLPYDAGVTQGGDPFATIKINVTLPVSGIRPGLQIGYLGGLDRFRKKPILPGDTLGYGWGMVGFASIRWCNKHFSSDPQLRLDGTDGLCMNGMPLVLVSGEHMQPDAEYRRLHENFSKIFVRGSAPGSTIWFEVIHPDKTVYTIGNSPDSRLGDGQPNFPFVWAINRVRDEFGNEMHYEYQVDNKEGVLIPTRIVYGYEGAGEILFRYTQRSDVKSVQTGYYKQTQRSRLNRIEIHIKGIRLLEYRLESEHTSQGWERLSRVQLCRYPLSGGRDCLEPLRLEWEEPGMVPSVSTVVNKLIDSLGNVTEFTYGILTGTDAEDFVFGPDELPFGEPNKPPDIQQLSASSTGNVKPVVIGIERSNNNGTHRLKYAYHSPGWESMRQWGFLGFYAVSMTDMTSGEVTYRQYRMDFPHYGQVSGYIRYDRDARVLSKQFLLHDAKIINHGVTQTFFPYIWQTTDFIYEDGVQQGVLQKTNELTVSNNQVTKQVNTRNWAPSASSSNPAGVWGDTHFNLQSGSE